MIPHPIPYQGSKRSLAAHIMCYFPTDAARLIEPFAGSAAVTLAAAQGRKTTQFLLNDINMPLMILWDHIINSPDALANQYAELWNLQQGQERDFYNQVRTRFNQSHQPSDLLYLLARCVKASVRYNAQGEFNQSPDNRRKGRHPDAMRRDIQRAAVLLKNKVNLRADDYRIVLEQTIPNDIVYLDPPYQGVCIKADPRYIKGVVFQQFVETLKHLNERAISYIVSYDGRSGSKTFGRALPQSLNLQHIEINAGRSSQATLLGRDIVTYETLYLSPALIKRLDTETTIPAPPLSQLSFPGELM